LVRLSALGFRPAAQDLRPSVPVREGEAQHSRRHRGATVPVAAAQREAEGEPGKIRQSRGVTIFASPMAFGDGGSQGIRSRLVARGVGLVGAVALCAAAGAQDAVEAFYRDRTVNLIVGYGPGGGYDVVARLVARHLGRFIPGHPKIIVQNMPGAGSMR